MACISGAPGSRDASRLSICQSLLSTDQLPFDSTLAFFAEVGYDVGCPDADDSISENPKRLFIALEFEESVAAACGKSRMTLSGKGTSGNAYITEALPRV